MMSTYNYLYALSYVVFKVQLHFLRHLSMPSGDEGIRTPDPLLAGQVLSQLSYTPIGFLGSMQFSCNEPSKLNSIERLVTDLGRTMFSMVISLERR